MARPNVLPGPTPGPASIKELRTAVLDLSARGGQEVDAVRRAFVSGISPVQAASSGSKADFIARFAGAPMPATIVRSTAQFGLATSVVAAPPPPPRPELDFVEVGFDRSFGVLDSFFTRVVFSLPLEELGRVSYLRVLRAFTGRVSAPRPAFSALAESIPLSARTKSNDAVSNSAMRVGGVGIANKLADFVVDDRFTTQRNVLSGSAPRPLPERINSNRGATAAGLVSVANADRSILEDVSFYVNRRNVTPVAQVTLPLEAGQRQGVNILRGSTIGSGTPVIAEGNSLGFFEVARLPAVPTRKVGAIAEFEFFDPSVVYGAGYVYYVIAVSDRLVASTRSRLVSVEVTRSSLPPTPSVVFSVPDVPRFSIRSSGSFIDHFEVFRRGGTPPASITLVSTPRAMVDSGPTLVLDSGFYHIGDVAVGADRSATFVDRGVAHGVTVDYRVYAVDSFGMKSQTPFSCSVRLPDPSRVVPLGIPSITAQQGSGRMMDVSVSCDDRRVSSFVVRRRDLSIGERLFRQPTHPEYFRLGSTDVKRARSRLGPALSQFSPNAWLGIIEAVSGSANFSDPSVEFDRVYQYSAIGVDVRGNETAHAVAQPVMVSVKPVSDAPVLLTGTVLMDPSGSPSAVLVSWSAGTLDFSPAELIDDQDVLAATAQRSVFQVERRQVGGFVWSSMPAVTSSYFIDPVGRGTAPKFRPAFAVPSVEYEYRVIAMQSGAFVSQYTRPIRVSVSPSIFPPSELFVRATSTAVRPVRIVVSWDYRGFFVDGWEVERAVTNRVFGARILSMDSSLARSLDYGPAGRVTRESSRALGVSGEVPPFGRRAFTGNRGFIDLDVSMANSYFYRVRSFDPTGRTSDWAYGGIFLTDSPFERKFATSVSDEERVAMSADPRPLLGWSRE